jgi:predicted RNA polymerase sigma factor
MSSRASLKEASGPEANTRLRRHDVSEKQIAAIVKGRPPLSAAASIGITDLAAELAENAEDYSREITHSYVVAEAAMAQRMASQLRSGSRTLDLSVTYATSSETAAQARHGKALENLKPLIDEAARYGYKVNSGEVKLGREIRAGEVLAEVPMRIAV